MVTWSSDLVKELFNETIKNKIFFRLVVNLYILSPMFSETKLQFAMTECLNYVTRSKTKNNSTYPGCLIEWAIVTLS